MLEDHGHEIVRYTVSNDEFDNTGVIGKFSAALGMLWSFKNYKKVKKLVETEKPDIVHIHTFFPLLSPSILYAAKRSGARVVATLHDTRFIFYLFLEVISSLHWEERRRSFFLSRKCLMLLESPMFISIRYQRRFQDYYYTTIGVLW